MKQTCDSADNHFASPTPFTVWCLLTIPKTGIWSTVPKKHHFVIKARDYGAHVQ